MTSSLSNSVSAFVNNLETLLMKGNTVEALTIFNDNKNSLEVINNSWDMIPIVSKYLTEEYEKSKVNVFKCCEYLINAIAEQSKAEEALLQFIEEIESTTDDKKFLTLLKPLTKILLRVPERRFASLAWCFNSTQCYLNQIDISDVNLNANTALVQRIVLLYGELLNFYGVFVDELCNKKNRNPLQVDIITKFMLLLLGKPIGFLNFRIIELKLIAENLIKKILCLTNDPFRFLVLRPNKKCVDNNEFTTIDSFGLAIFYYLIFSEEICIQQIPKVYDPVYVFQNSLYFVNLLLQGDNNYFTIEKGFSLITQLLQNIDNLEISYLLLESTDHNIFCKCLTEIIIYNESETIRKSGLSIFQKYLSSFDIRGKFLLIKNLISHINHTSLNAYLITQYKEVIRIEISQHSNPLEVSNCIRGCKLFDVLRIVYTLKSDVNVDVTDYSDEIVACLNLLRYIFLADKDCKYTQICLFSKDIQKFFDDLSNAIKMTRISYENKKQDLIEEKVKYEPNKEFSLAVSGQSVPQSTTTQTLNLLNLALTTLDVLESLLVRVLECCSF